MPNKSLMGLTVKIFLLVRRNAGFIEKRERLKMEYENKMVTILAAVSRWPSLVSDVHACSFAKMGA